jgi:uncharacterized protein (DUF2267 family)
MSMPRTLLARFFGVLNKHISKGEIEQVKGLLPRELRAFWPEPLAV